ncbi:hypothetical protein VTH82DRAFT_5609 [Thermothelomyces myriococcoides]
MSQTMVRLRARPSSMAAGGLDIGRSSSTISTLFVRRIQNRPFHITLPHHRRPPPPPIRIAKPKPTSPPPPESQSPQPAQKDAPKPEQSPATNNDNVPPGERPHPGTFRERFQRSKSRSNWSTEALIILAILAVFIPGINIVKGSGAITGDGDGDDDDDDESGKPACLNPTSFTPFTITAREQVSPTAFVLTVRPSEPPARGRRVVADAWRHGLWAVEVKQPECMVAREYTPLPSPPLLPPPSPSPSPSSSSSHQQQVGKEGAEGVVVEVEEEAAADDGGRRQQQQQQQQRDPAELRFYVRRMPGGEVSGYLARLRVGDEIELRGPRLAFDLRARLGLAAVGDDGLDDDGAEKNKNKKTKKKKVVFLAGGTGIAPALQAASTLMDDPRVEMEVIWANRRKEDCVGCGDGKTNNPHGNPVLELLDAFQKRYGEHRFRYSCTVDEEGSFIDSGAVARATGASTTTTTTTGPSGLARLAAWAGLRSSGGDVNHKDDAAASPPISDACAYHSARKLISSDERDPPFGTGSQLCQCKDADGNPVQGGKNLLMISGPDGFIAHLAGVKVWHDGRQRQGPVAGIFRDLAKKYPSLGDDWLVLKM